MPTGLPHGKRAYTPDHSDVLPTPSSKRRKIMAKSADISFPTHQAYDPQVIALQIELQALMSGLSQTLQQHRTSSDEFENAYQLVIEAAQDPGFTKPTIGLYGRSDEGKSELINALTGQLDGAKAVSSGRAVTSMAMLLVSGLSSQAHRHAAEVRMLSQVEIETTMESYVKAYTRYFFENSSDISKEEDDEMEAAAILSIQRLQTLFNDKKELMDNTTLHSFMRTYYDNDSQIVKQLVLWYEALCDGFTLHDGQLIRRFEFDTSEALNAALERYIYDRDTIEQPLLWPLVEIVLKVCPDSEHLNYFNLLDLPGIAGTDTGRGNTAHKHFLRCQALWAVGNIGRASTDEKLDNILATYGTRFGSNIALIATSSDFGFGLSTAQELEKLGADMSAYFERSQHLTDLQEQLLQVDEQYQAAKAQGNIGLFADQRDELRDVSLPQAKVAQLDAFVNGRNAFMVKDLQHKKAKHLSDGVQLTVCCVSSTHFNAHNGSTDRPDTIMSANTTNIPWLRLRALQLAGDEKFRSCLTGITKAIGVMESLTLWTLSDRTRRPKGITKIIEAPVNKLDSFSRTFTNKTEAVLEQRVVRPLCDRRVHFRQHALVALSEIHTQYHQATFRAFVFNNGNYRTPLKDAIWNEEFMLLQNGIINSMWNVFIAEQSQLFRNGIKDMVGCIQSMFQQLAKIVDPNSLQSLEDLLVSHIDRIRNCHATRMQGIDGLEHRLAVIKEQATKDVTTAYFSLAMAPTYDACKQERGVGSLSRMHTTLANTLDGWNSPIQQPCPFEAVRNGLAVDISAEVTQLGVALHTDIEAILQELARDLKRACQGATSARSPAEKKSHEQLKAKLEEDKPRMDAVKTDLSAVKKKYEMADDEMKQTEQEGFLKSISRRLGLW